MANLRTDYEDGELFLAEYINETNEAVNQIAAGGGGDRPYDPEKPNEMGRKVLSSDKTFAQQVTDANTIYEIRYDFDFGNTTVNMPANCILHFNGGSIHNGTLNGNGTLLENCGVKSMGCSLTGTFVNDVIYASWLKASSASALTTLVTSIFNLTEVVTLFVDIDITLHSGTTASVKRVVIDGEYTITNCCAFNVDDYVYIKNVTINRNVERMLITHIGTANTSSSVTIDKVTFDGKNICKGLFEVMTSGSADSLRISVTNCELYNFTHYGIKCYKDCTANIKFNYLHDFGNSTANNNVLGISLGYQDTYHSVNSTISNNTIENILCPYAAGNDLREAHGILVYGSNNEVSYNRVTNMYSNGESDNAGTDTEGIYLKGDYNTISYNSLIDAVGEDVEVSGTTYACDGAITLKNSKRSYIQNNFVQTKRGKAIVADVEYCVISNNTIISKADSNYGMYVYSGSLRYGNIVKDNYLECADRTTGIDTIACFLYKMENIVFSGNELRYYPTALYGSSTGATAKYEGNKFVFGGVHYENEGMAGSGKPHVQIYTPNNGDTVTHQFIGNTFEYEDLHMGYYARLINGEKSSSQLKQNKTIFKGNTFVFKFTSNTYEIFNFMANVGEVVDNTFIYNSSKITTLFKDMQYGIVTGNRFDIPSNKSIATVLETNSSHDIAGQSGAQYDNNRVNVLRSGATTNRPTSDDIMSGFQYFDTTLGKPIWWNGTAWIDSTGADPDATPQTT